MPADDPAATIRRLRSQLRAAQDEVEQLREMLVGRDAEIRALRARIESPVRQAAAPRRLI